MRIRKAHIGALVAGCAIALAAPAIGAHKAAPAPDTAAAHTEHAAPITIRQNLAYGRQETWVAGVKITRGGHARFGRGGKLRNRVGGWSCSGGYAEKGSRFRVVMTGLGGNSCNLAEVAVTRVISNARGARIVTDFGTVRVGQTWRSVPKKLKSRVYDVDRSGRAATYWIGRYQNYCNPKRPLPRTWERTGQQSPVLVAVSASGRVEGIEVRTMIVEGVNCP